MKETVRKEKITKLGIAKRELSEAIMLFFEDRDPVTYYLLGHTSHEIIKNIANAKGIKSMVKDDMEGMINEEGLDKVLIARYGKEYKLKKKGIREKINFFVNIEYYKLKHGGGNAEEVVTVHWDTIQVLMLDSIEMLRRVGVTLSSEHVAFMLWIKKIMPEIYNNIEIMKALNAFEREFGEASKQNLLDFINDSKSYGFEELLQKRLISSPK